MRSKRNLKITLYLILAVSLISCGGDGGGVSKGTSGGSGGAGGGGGYYAKLNWASFSPTAINFRDTVTFSWNGESSTFSGIYRIVFYASADDSLDTDNDFRIFGTNCMDSLAGMSRCASNGDGAGSKFIVIPSGEYFIFVVVGYYTPTMSWEGASYTLTDKLTVL